MHKQLPPERLLRTLFSALGLNESCIRQDAHAYSILLHAADTHEVNAGGHVDLRTAQSGRMRDTANAARVWWRTCREELQ